MTSTAPPSAIERLERRTSQPIAGWLEAFARFVVDDLPGLTAFYRGQREPDAAAVTRLAELRALATAIAGSVRAAAPGLTRLADIQLQQLLQDSRSRLETIANLAFYLRSSRTLAQYRQGLVGTYTTARGETTEQVARRRMGARSTDDQTWQQLVLDNNLDEEDLEPEHSLDLVLHQPVDLPTTGAIQVVLGSQVGEAAAGRDLPRRLRLDVLANDFAVLSPSETVQQSAEVLLGLKIGQVPQYPELGVIPSLAVGQTAWQLGLPGIVRQLQRVFATDDTFRGLRVTAARQEVDNLTLDVELTTLLGNLSQSTAI